MKVLMATDGSPGTELALRSAVDLLLQRDAGIGIANAGLEIVLLAVTRGTILPTAANAGVTTGKPLAPSAAISILARSKRFLVKRGIIPKALWRVGDDPAAIILETARDEFADLIVLGCRESKELSAGSLDGVSDEVLKQSVVPVLVLREQQAS